MAGQGAGPILLSANGDPARFARFRLPVLPDAGPGYPGPLAGVLAGMEWTSSNRPAATDLITVPTDCPFVPRDLVLRLLAARRDGGSELACGASAGRMHPLAALWPIRLAPLLRRALLEEGLHRVDRWTARFRLAVAEFAVDKVDPFLNVNTLDDLHAAEALARPSKCYDAG